MRISTIRQNLLDLALIALIGDDLVTTATDLGGLLDLPSRRRGVRLSPSHTFSNILLLLSQRLLALLLSHFGTTGSQLIVTTVFITDVNRLSKRQFLLWISDLLAVIVGVDPGMILTLARVRD